MRTGMVWVNTWLHRDLRTPFGGVKDSGVGKRVESGVLDSSPSHSMHASKIIQINDASMSIRRSIQLAA